MDSHIIRETAPAESPTLLQIAGFPHWENVYSNILAFFLHSDEAHGFGPLFIRSLMAAYCCECGQDRGVKDTSCLDAVEATDAVEREVKTSDDKRIDLLVDCAEFRVCIENKIWASLYNDLAHYREHCESDSDGRPVLGIVLSPEAVTGRDELKLKAHRFVSITYEDLVKQVRRLMGSYIGPHNMQYQYLLFDFLEQASRLRTTHMNDDERAFLDFWKENEPKISNIEEWTTKIWKVLNAKAKAQDHIEKCLERLEKSEREVFRDWIYQKRVAVFDLAKGGTIDGARTFLDVEFHPLRVTHFLGSRQGGSAPTAFAGEINDSCCVNFSKSPTQSDRLKFATEESPIDGLVCEKVVETSVRILKYIAERHLAEKT